MLDVCIYFVTDIFAAAFKTRKSLCVPVAGLVAWRTDGDDGHLQPHTLTDAVFMWGRGRRRVSGLHSAALRCIFSLSLIEGAHVQRRGDEWRLPTTPRL